MRGTIVEKVDILEFFIRIEDERYRLISASTNKDSVRTVNSLSNHT